MVVMVYMKDRSPTKALTITPYEVWNSEKPNLGHLQIISCRAAAHVLDELRKKAEWMSKSTNCIFIGYSETENLFQLWDIKPGSIIYKRDVVFFEDQLGHLHLIEYTLPEGAIVGEYEICHIPRKDLQVDQINIPLHPLLGSQSVQKLQESKRGDDLIIKQWNLNMMTQHNIETR